MELCFINVQNAGTLCVLIVIAAKATRTAMAGVAGNVGVPQKPHELKFE